MLIDLTPPVAGAAPIEDLADQLRLPQGYASEPEGAARLERLATSALCVVEARTGRVLIERRFLLRLESWPDGGRVVLPVAPVKAIESLTILDADGGRFDVDPAQLRLDALGCAPSVMPWPVRPWPVIPKGGLAEFTLRAGYGPGWDAVPADLRLAVTMLGAALHDAGLDADTMALPFGVLALTEPYRRIRI